MSQEKLVSVPVAGKKKAGCAGFFWRRKTGFSRGIRKIYGQKNITAKPRHAFRSSNRSLELRPDRREPSPSDHVVSRRIRRQRSRADERRLRFAAEVVHADADRIVLGERVVRVDV